MLELHRGELDLGEIFARWFGQNRRENYGAFAQFIGVVRDESIDGLSFDVYEPLLRVWFESASNSATKRGARVLMAHSVGFVPKHGSSFFVCVLSAKRRAALEILDEFVENFKSNAPIWKYDVVGGEKKYAADRSKTLPHAGLLG